MESGDGMSFAEFTYPILQSWDWWHMYQHKQIQIQIGGSDQYGNITAGVDAINYIIKHHYDPKVRIESPGLHHNPLGFTTPLLTTASGEKFGKSAGNAIWLDKDMTSTFDLYQVSSFPTSPLKRLKKSPVLSPNIRCRCRAIFEALYIYSHCKHSKHHCRAQRRCPKAYSTAHIGA